MESGDDYIIQLISMLPSYLQSRLPIVPLRLRSFGSLQSSIAGTACGSSSQTRATTLSRNFNNINGNAECSSYSELTEASSSSGSFTSTRRRSITTSLSSILANDDDDQDHPGNAMAEQGPIDEIHYEQFVRHFLRSVREVDTRRQLDSRRLLEGSQTQPGDLQVRPPRLPRHFNGRSHDTVDQRWSPSGIKWRYARQGMLR